MTPEAIDLLLTCCELGRWHVTSTTICSIAELLNEGLVAADDDYESIPIFITDKGREYALQQDWLQSDPDANAEPWTRTEAGKAASNFIDFRP